MICFNRIDFVGRNITSSLASVICKFFQYVGINAVCDNLITCKGGALCELSHDGRPEHRNGASNQKIRGAILTVTQPDSRLLLENLPDVCLSSIFKYVEVKEDLCNMRLVCKEWRALVMSFREVLLFRSGKGHPCSTQDMLRLLGKTPTVPQLSFEEGWLNKERMELVGRTYPELPSFHMCWGGGCSWSALDRPDHQDFALLLQRCSDMKALNLEYCITINVRSLQAIAMHCRGLKTLRLLIATRVLKENESTGLSSLALPWSREGKDPSARDEEPEAGTEASVNKEVSASASTNFFNKIWRMGGAGQLSHGNDGATCSRGRDPDKLTEMVKIDVLNALLDITRNNPSLQKLELEWGDAVDTDMMGVLMDSLSRSCPRLQEIDFRGHASRGLFAAFQSRECGSNLGISTFSALKILRVATAEGESLAGLPESCRWLEVLEWRGSYDSEDTSKGKLLEGLSRHCPNLRELCIAGVRPFGHFKGTFGCLKKLMIETFSNDGLQGVSPACPALEVLEWKTLANLEGWQYNSWNQGNLVRQPTDASGVALEAFRERQPGLRELNLELSLLQTPFLTSTRTFGSLQKLTLSSPSDALLKSVPKACPNLEHIVIRFCAQCSWKGLRPVLEGCPSLKVIECRTSHMKLKEASKLCSGTRKKLLKKVHYV